MNNGPVFKMVSDLTKPVSRVVHHPRWHWAFPIALCVFWAAFCFPTVFYNLDDTRMIAYFSHDEIYLLDTIWYFYSGEYNPETIQEASIEGMRDYGLLFRYIVDLSRIFIEPFTEITPGLLWGIVRSLYLACGLLAILALWRMAIRHFGKGWVPVISVLGLALCPSFVWHLDFCKPEPITLLLTIVAFDHILQIVEHGSIRSIVIASACAVGAIVVKYIGIFILPVIMSAIFFHWWLSKDCYNPTVWEPNWDKAKMLAPVLGIGVGGGLLALTYWGTFSHVQSKGLTLAQEFGFPEVLLVCPPFIKPLAPVTPIIAFVVGLFMIVGSILWGARINSLGRIIESSRRGIIFSQMFFVIVLVLGLSAALFVILGFRWILDPKDFINKFIEVSSYSLFSKANPIGDPIGYGKALFFNIGEFLFTISGLRLLLFGWYNNPNVAEPKIAGDIFTPFGLVLILWFVFAEFRGFGGKWSIGDIKFFKRLHLALFFVGFASYMVLTASHNTRHMHHLMYLVPPGFLLIGQIPQFLKIKASYQKKLFILVALLAAAFSLNGQTAIRWRINKLEQGRGSDDVVWQVQKWWRENVSPETPILMDQPYIAYLPPEYENVSHFRYGKDISQTRASIRKKLDERKPQLFYYNLGPRGTQLPPIKDLIPEYRFRLIARFQGNFYTRLKNNGDRFLVYEVLSGPQEPDRKLM